MQLKLAAAIIARPRILLLNQLFDVMPNEALRDSLDMLQQESETTVIYFSSRRRPLDFDSYLYLGKTKQGVYSSFENLCRATGNQPCDDESREALLGAPA